MSFSVIFLITLHGFPNAITPDGISFVTTLPAPITVLLPIVTPGSTVTFAPIHTSSPTVIGNAISSPSARIFASMACPSRRKDTTRCNKNIITKAYLCPVKYRAVIICVKIVPDRNIESIITIKRLCYIKTAFDTAKHFFDYFFTSVCIRRSAHIIFITQICTFISCLNNFFIIIGIIKISLFCFFPFGH